MQQSCVGARPYVLHNIFKQLHHSHINDFFFL